jgi:hypothetical protein
MASDAPLAADEPRFVADDTAVPKDPFIRRAIVPVALALLTVTVVYALVYVTVVKALVYDHWWYGEHDVSDIVIYQDHAKVMLQGLLPYRDFELEYPPLAPALFALPGHADDYAAYTHWFNAWMYVFSLLTAVVTALVGVAIWPRGRRAWLVAVAAGLAMAAVGTIVENRFDIVVALCMVTALLFVCVRRPLPAAVALGIGFALKLTPIILLPLVLILARGPKRKLAALAAFAVSAAIPFIPYIAMAPRGVAHIFTYHMDRPLQIESVLATPFLLGRVFHRVGVEVVTAYGSQGIAAPGTGLAASVSTWLTIAALALVAALVWRRRRVLEQQPDLIPVAAFAFILAAVVFGKVLSPQYMVWLVPFVAVVVVRDQWLGGMGFATLLLTQINFPVKYWNLVYLEPNAIMWLAARNALLVATFAFALVRLWDPGGPSRRARRAGRRAARADDRGETPDAGDVTGADGGEAVTYGDRLWHGSEPAFEDCGRPAPGGSPAERPEATVSPNDRPVRDLWGP